MKRYGMFKNKETLIRWQKNLLKFTAPALVVFFFQLSQGAEPKVAGSLMLLALYGLVADALKKIGDEKTPVKSKVHK